MIMTPCLPSACASAATLSATYSSASGKSDDGWLRRRKDGPSAFPRPDQLFLSPNHHPSPPPRPAMSFPKSTYTYGLPIQTFLYKPDASVVGGGCHTDVHLPPASVARPVAGFPVGAPAPLAPISLDARLPELPELTSFTGARSHRRPWRGCVRPVLLPAAAARGLARANAHLVASTPFRPLDRLHHRLHGPAAGLAGRLSPRPGPGGRRHRVPARTFLLARRVAPVLLAAS